MKKEMKKETYNVDMFCENCKTWHTVQIEKGKLCAGYHLCPKCGCKDLKM